MTKRLARIAERRALLLARASAQRQTLAISLDTLRRPLSLVDKGLSVFRFVAKHPAWIVGSALVPAALRPGRVGSWLRTGFMALQVLNRMRAARSRP